MRLFVSVKMPREVQKNVEPMYFELKKLNTSVVQLDKLHCTLCFIGEVPEEELEQIKTKLSKVTFNTFTVKAKGIGAFPGFRSPRVIWLGLQSTELLSLAARVSSVLKISEKRKFKPHCTLARAKPRIDIGFLEKHALTDFGSFKVKSFELVQSVLTPRGALYKTKLSVRKNAVLS